MKSVEKESIKRLYIKSLKEELRGKEKEELLRRRRSIRVGLLGGFFDFLHIGHIKALKEAKDKVDVLVVVIAREKEGEWKKPIHTIKERVELVSSIKYVDIVIEGRENKLETLRKVDPDVIFYGYDQEEFIKEEGVEIVRLSPYKPEKIKTTKIKKHYGFF